VFNGAANAQPGSDRLDPLDHRVLIARRKASEAGYRIARSTWIRRTSTTRTLAEWVQVSLDEASHIVIAAETNSIIGDILHTRLDMTQPIVENAGLTHSGYGVYESAVSVAATAAYTWKFDAGTYDARTPRRLTIYSPASAQWTTTDITAYSLWGATSLVGTDAAGGEFLLFSGCKLTAWRAGRWGATRELPAFCGRDQAGGVYAFNRQGDYVGINWAGRAGQWGYYNYAQNKLLKGVAGSGNADAADFVLGTPSTVFGDPPTQLLLAPNGLALAITSNTYARLPSRSESAGVASGTAIKLWGVYLK
jgi:hypothetical protein